MKNSLSDEELALTLGKTTADAIIPAAQVVFLDLLHASVVAQEDWGRLAPQIHEELSSYDTLAELLPKLTEYGLLTEYQATRIAAGTAASLIMGNYRILDRLGAGGMGVVFKAEHIDLRRPVAIKVLALSSSDDPQILGRFNAEMRAVARLQHPNIVAAVDAGKYRDHDPDGQEFRYFVMEYVAGRDLEQYIKEGPLAVVQACDVVHQIAAALAEAHEHQLVHRDIKPSNILLTPEGQAKLLDFGLALNWSNRITQFGTMLGTIDFMAPEQATDAASVDIRADIYGLGGTLYWCLTGQAPFPPRGNLAEEVARRLTQAPPAPRALRPEIPRGLDAVVVRMLARNPAERYDNPRAVMRALVPFLKPERSGHPAARAPLTPEGPYHRRHRLLIVDDDAQIREFTKIALQAEDIVCDEAANGDEALRIIGAAPYDLVVLDIDMPGLSGHQVCRRLREYPPWPYLKIIMFSGRASTDEMAQIMNEGADDFLTKPFSIVQLQARVRAALRLKAAQERAESLAENLRAVNQNLAANLTARDADSSLSREVLVVALAELVAMRDDLSAAHLSRLPRYCRRLLEEAARTEIWQAHIDEPYIQMLECCVPLHDIGNAMLPDGLLKKPGRLSPEERLFMQTHASAGAEILQKVARKHGLFGAFLQMASDVIRHHHERYDGQGYADHLAGEAIPLAARVVAIADVYDALRSRRSYRPSLSHASTLEVMLDREATGRTGPDTEWIFQDSAG